MGTTRISEQDLIIPALQIFSSRENGTTTTELIKGLTIMLKPSGKDAEIIQGRKDSYFSQIVRNLRSHNVFEKNKLATYQPASPNGKFFITDAGKNFLLTRAKEIRYIYNNNFSLEEKRTASVNLLEKQRTNFFITEEEINEGLSQETTTKTRTRSTKLRKYALKYYTQKNQIKCTVCNFNFAKTYGQYGQQYIEFHHIKPIATYDKKGLKTNLKQAINNLRPVCANCHRIIHRHHLTLKELQKALKK